MNFKTMYNTVIFCASFLVYFCKPSSCHYDLELNKTFAEDFDVDIISKWKETQTIVDKLDPMGDELSKEVDNYFMEHIYKESLPSIDVHLFNNFGVANYFQFVLLLDHEKEPLGIVKTIYNGKSIVAKGKELEAFSKFKLRVSECRDPTKLSTDVTGAAKKFLNKWTNDMLYLHPIVSQVGLFYDPNEYTLEPVKTDSENASGTPLSYLQCALVFKSENRPPHDPIVLPESNEVPQIVPASTSNEIVTEQKNKIDCASDEKPRQDVKESK